MTPKNIHHASHQLPPQFLDTPTNLFLHSHLGSAKPIDSPHYQRPRQLTTSREEARTPEESCTWGRGHTCISEQYGRRRKQELRTERLDCDGIVDTDGEDRLCDETCSDDTERRSKKYKYNDTTPHEQHPRRPPSNTHTNNHTSLHHHPHPPHKPAPLLPPSPPLQTTRHHNPPPPNPPARTLTKTRANNAPTRSPSATHKSHRADAGYPAAEQV